jgi:hypothetical protein
MRLLQDYNLEILSLSLSLSLPNISDCFELGPS